MIQSFKCKKTQSLFERAAIHAPWRSIAPVALRKLNYLHAARSIEDMRIPPANRLEKLKGNRAGQWSIRINDQWRICFVFKGEDVFEVQIVDYH